MPKENNNEWKFVMTEWRGYVVRSLEDINTEITACKILTKDSEERITKKLDELSGCIKNHDKEINSIKIKVAEYGAAAGIVSSLIVPIILKYVGVL